MAGVLVDPGGVAGAAAQLAAAGSGAAGAAGGPVSPAAADPVSVTVAQTLSARASAIAAYSAAAGAITEARARMLADAAAGYGRQKAANRTSLVLGAGAPALLGAPPAPLAPAPVLPAPVGTPVFGPPPPDGRAIAALMHAGAGPAGLYAGAARVRAHADELIATASRLRGSAAQLGSDWQSGAGRAAVARISELASWYDRHAGQAGAAATAFGQQAERYSRARAAIPTPQRFAEVHKRLAAASAANSLPGSYGRYAGVITALQTQLTRLDSEAISQYGVYRGGAAAANLAGPALSPPPGVDGLDNHTFKQDPPPPPAPGDMSSGDIDAIDKANRALLQNMLDEYSRLPDGQVKTDRLADIAAIREALKVPDSHLIYLDRPDNPADMIPAATAIGDPFNADHVSVTVPGVSGSTRQTIATMTREAAGLRDEARDIAHTVKGVSDNVSTIAWAGYQPPPVLTSWDTLDDGLARAGAPKLEAFLQNLAAGSHTPGHTVALFGHSYGSLLSGIALKDGASSLVDNVVLYGSPGFEATSPAKLGMNDHNFFVMTAPDDPIGIPAALAPLHGWGSDPNEIIDGSPDRYRFTHLQTDAGWVNVGGEEIYKTGASGHSEYGRDPLHRMTGYNLATILLDRADLAVREGPP